MSDPAFPRSEEGFDDPVEAFRMPLMDHLRELRRRLIISIVTLIIAVAVCFTWVNDIWAFLVAPMNAALNDTGRGTLAITAPLEGMTTFLKVSGVAGLGLASPILFAQAWGFVAPGLYPNEKRFVIPLAIASSGLFLAGGAFCYFVIFTYAFPFFITVTGEDVQAVLSISAYLELATQLLVAFGVCFQLPVVAFALARVGLIDHLDLLRFFRYAIVAIFAVSAILTPPDVLSQVLMAIPLTVLYILSIGIAWVFTTKKREPAAEGAAS